MNDISHKQAIQWIHRRMDGLLNENQSLMLDDHLQSCESCRAYALNMDGLSAHLQSEFHRRWDEQSGPSQNVMEHVMAKARSIPLANRISSGTKLLAGATTLIVLAVAINFVVSRLQNISPAINATVNPSSLPEDGLLAFASDQNGNFDIYTMQAEGSVLTNITENPAADISPFWSPDGQRIAFTSDRSGSMQIYLMDADGSNAIQLTNGEGSYSFDINGLSPWSPDSRKLVFFHTLPGEQDITLQVMDIADKYTIILTEEPGGYLLPSWSPDGKYIGFTAYTDGGPADLFIVEFDGTRLTKLTENLPGGEFVPLEYHWSQDGEHLIFITQGGTYSVVYSASPDGSLNVVHRSRENKHILDWWNGTALIDNPLGIMDWLRPDGSQSTLELCQRKRDTDAMAYKRSYNGNLVLASNCSDNNWMFYWANPDGTEIDQLLDSPLSIEDGLFNPMWSLDDKYIAFVGNRTLYVLDVAKARKDPSIRPLKMPNSFGPSWQPRITDNVVTEVPTPQPTLTYSAGSLLAFTSDQSGNHDIYTILADGSGLTNLTNHPARDSNPIWSPDGKHIAFESDRNGFMQIYLMNADGSNVVQLTHDEAFHYLPMNIHGVSNPWSPDGNKLLFLKQEPVAEISTLYSLDIQTGSTVMLANGTVLFNNISWSPDGKYVGYVVNNSPTPEATFVPGIYVVDSAGGALIEVNKLVPQTETIDSPSFYWLPDENSIIFKAYQHIDEGRDQWIAYQVVLESNQLIERARSSTPMEDWWEGTSFIRGTDLSTLTWLRSDGTFNTFKPLEICQLTGEVPFGFFMKRSPHGNQAINIDCPTNEKWLYYASSDGAIIKPLLSFPIPASTVDTLDTTIAWSPDDQFIAVNIVSRENSRLYILHVGDPSVQPREIVISDGELYTVPSWRPIP